MQLTPIDIQHKQFRVRFRGFDIQEVDLYLEEVAEGFDALQDENAKLREELTRLRQANQHFKEREAALKRALVNSKKALAQIKEKALATAARITSDAHAEARQILDHAHHRLAQLNHTIAERQHQRLQIEEQIRTIIESHAQLLKIDLNDRTAPDSSDPKKTDAIFTPVV